MSNYLIRRLGLLIPTMIIVSMLVFLVIRLVPGSVIDYIIASQALGANGSQNSGATIDRAAIEHKLGLDLPVHVQYWRWVTQIIFHGNLGTSMVEYYSVNGEIAGRLSTTFELGILAILIGLIIALPIGIYSAIRQETIIDYLGRSAAILFISLPSFWVTVKSPLNRSLNGGLEIEIIRPLQAGDVAYVTTKLLEGINGGFTPPPGF